MRQQFLSKARAAQALAELFGTPISQGTVAAMVSRGADALGVFTAQIRRRLREAQVVGFDETGFRVAGKPHWVHCARTDRYTLVSCHPKRGVKGMAQGWRRTPPAGQWCWAEQASRALVELQILVDDAVAAGHTAVEEARRADLVTQLRSAALIGAKETSARSNKLMLTGGREMGNHDA